MNSCARIGSDEKDAIGSGRRRAQEGNEIKNRPVAFACRPRAEGSG